MKGQEGRRRIAFVIPMRVELRPLVRSLSLRRSALGDMPAHTGTVGGTEVIAVATGIGTRAAAEATERLLRAATVDHVVVVGVAGGVEPGIRIGDVVVPEVVVMAPTGDEYRPSPIGGSEARGRLLTSAELKTGPDVLAALRAQNVTAVDMETASIAAVCERAGVPWSVFRGISDRLADNILEESFIAVANPDGTPKLGATLRLLATRPRSIRGLMSLSRDTRVAAEAAADAAIRACL